MARDSAEPLNGKVVSYADLLTSQCRKTTVCSTLDVNEDNFGDSDEGKHLDVTHTTSRGVKGRPGLSHVWNVVSRWYTLLFNSHRRTCNAFKTTYVSLRKRVGRKRIRHVLLVYGRTRAVSSTHRFIFSFHTSGQTRDDRLASAFDKLHRTIINFSGSSKNRVVRRCLSRGRASIWQDWTRKSGQSNSSREATPAAKNDQITAFKTGKRTTRDGDVYFRLLAALVDAIPIIRDGFIMTAEPIG